MKVAKFNVQVYLNAGLLEQNSLTDHADSGWPQAIQGPTRSLTGRKDDNSQRCSHRGIRRSKSNWEKGRQLPTTLTGMGGAVEV